MQNKSTFGKISMFLAAGLFGFLNPRSGQRAPVLDHIDQAIREDVAAQKADREASQGRRKNRLAQLEAEHGDIDIAERRLQMEMTEVAAKQARAEAHSAQSEAHKMAAADLEAQLTERAAKMRADIEKTDHARPVEVTESTGESGSVQRGESTQSARPAAPKTEDPLDRALKLARLRKMMADADAAEREGKAGPKLNEQERKAAMVADSFAAVLKRAGVVVKDGQVTFPEGSDRDIPGRGPFDAFAQAVLESPIVALGALGGIRTDAKDLNQAMAFLRENTLRMLTGANAPDAEKEEVKRLLDATTEQNMVANLQILFENYIQRYAGDEMALPPSARVR
jgi:hypothetical protein